MTNPALQEVIALLGHPAAGNPAQFLFERVVARDSLDWRFLTLEAVSSRLADALAGISALGFRGCILAGPLREPAIDLTTSASPAAQFAAGCNLLECTKDGQLVGHLTLGRGALDSIRLHVDPATTNILLLGTNLLARSLALELTLSGTSGITIADPWDGQAKGLADAVNTIEGGHATVVEDELPPTCESVDIVIATEEIRPFPPNFHLPELREDLVVVDTSLDPKASPILKAATAANSCQVDGLEVTTATMAINFRSLTGIEPDTEALREALDEFLDY
ncbi:MAG: hypothetical protein HOH16_06090 [Planctomycetaceae bacterium]|nr:hypothetical protein [Planctomycetaceae bacterium]